MIFCKLPFMNSPICDNIIVVTYKLPHIPHIPHISETLTGYINKLLSYILHHNPNELINQKQFLYLYNKPPSFNFNVPTIIAPCNFFTFIEIYRHPQLSYLLTSSICYSYHITTDSDSAPKALKWIRREFVNDVINITPINNEISKCDYFTNLFTDDCKSGIDLVTCDIDLHNMNTLLQQIAFALFIQKKGGSFIFKTTETYTKQIIDIIVILMNLYSSVIIINTDTCEDLTVEHYIICINFNGCNEKINTIFSNILLDTTASLELNIKIPHIIINKIENFNSIVGQNKLFLMNNINNKVISSETKNKLDEEKNIKKCLTWCGKHYIPYNAIYSHIIN